MKTAAAETAAKKTAAKSATANAALAAAIKEAAEKLATMHGLKIKEVMAEVKAKADEILAGLVEKHKRPAEFVLGITGVIETLAKKSAKEIEDNIAAIKAKEAAEAAAAKAEEDRIAAAIKAELSVGMPSENQCRVVKTGQGKLLHLPVKGVFKKNLAPVTAAAIKTTITAEEIETGLAKLREKNPDHVTLLVHDQVEDVGFWAGLRWVLILAIKPLQDLLNGNLVTGDEEKKTKEAKKGLQAVIDLVQEGVIEGVFKQVPRLISASNEEKAAAREHLGAAGYGWILALVPEKKVSAPKADAPKPAPKAPKAKNPEAMKARAEFITGLNAAFEQAGVVDYVKLVHGIIKDYSGAETFPEPTDALRIKARNLQLAHEDTRQEGMSDKALQCALAAGIGPADVLDLVAKKRDQIIAEGAALSAAAAAKLDKPAKVAAPESKKNKKGKKGDTGDAPKGKGKRG
jgi:hypothetical protein